MTPEPWKPAASRTRQIGWRTCPACGKRYVVRPPPLSQRTLEDLEEGARRKHHCRTERQESALRAYEELEL